MADRGSGLGAFPMGLVAFAAIVYSMVPGSGGAPAGPKADAQECRRFRRGAPELPAADDPAEAPLRLPQRERGPTGPRPGRSVRGRERRVGAAPHSVSRRARARSSGLPPCLPLRPGRRRHPARRPGQRVRAGSLFATVEKGRRAAVAPRKRLARQSADPQPEARSQGDASTGAWPASVPGNRK